jgi:signal transduction histidine kinase
MLRLRWRPYNASGMNRKKQRPRAAAKRTTFEARRSAPRQPADTHGSGSRSHVELRELLEGAFDGMLVLDRLGRIRAGNLPASRLFGRPFEAIVGKRLRDLGGSAVANTAPEWATPQPSQSRLRITRPDQSAVEVVARKLRLDPGAQLWILRERISDSPATLALERKSRLLMDAERVGGVGGWELDLQTGLIAWTPEMSRIMGMPPEITQVRTEDCYQFYSEASRSIVREAFNATLARGTPYDLVLECITGKGERIWVREVCVAAMRGGRPVSVVGFTQDVTEHRRLAGLLGDIGNQERARIGADLHDGLGQELTGLALLLQSVAVRAERQGSAVAVELRELSKMASKSIETVREIAHGLLPLKMSHFGFREVLRRLARSSRATLGVQVSTRLQGESRHMPVGEMAENLYRIAQEAIANAVKHGGAKRVTMRVRAGETRIIFTATDDGSGIDMDQENEGMGLQIMRYRIRILGGLLDVQRMPRGGTQLRCVVPRTSSSS